MDDSCNLVIEAGDLEVLKMVHEIFGIPLSMSETCALVAEHGDLEMVKWVTSKGCEKTEEVCVALPH